MKSFTHKYIWQRITAVILLLLIPWVLWFLFTIKDLNYPEVIQTLKDPINKALILLVIINGFYHGYLGIKNICLDYLSNEKARLFILLFIGGGFALLSLLSGLSLLKLG